MLYTVCYHHHGQSTPPTFNIFLITKICLSNKLTLKINLYKNVLPFALMQTCKLSSNKWPNVLNTCSKCRIFTSKSLSLKQSMDILKYQYLKIVLQGSTCYYMGQRFVVKHYRSQVTLLNSQSFFFIKNLLTLIKCTFPINPTRCHFMEHPCGIRHFDKPKQPAPTTCVGQHVPSQQISTYLYQHTK